MMWHDGGWGWGAWVGTGFFMLLFWAVVIWAVVMLVRHTTASDRGPTVAAGPDEPIRVLERRFAAGEIDEEEFRRRRDVLRPR